MKFAQFMSSKSGRLLRIVVGVVLIVAGLQMKSTGGNILAIIGLVPLAAGVFGWCLLAPLLHTPFTAKAILAFKVNPKK